MFITICSQNPVECVNITVSMRQGSNTSGREYSGAYHSAVVTKSEAK